MITRENFKAVIESLDIEDIFHAMYVDNSDRIAVYCNSYGQANIIAWDPWENEEDVLSTGGFITDKDNFLIMCKEAGINMDELLDDYNSEEEDPLEEQSRNLESDYSDSYYDPYNF